MTEKNENEKVTIDLDSEDSDRFGYVPPNVEERGYVPPAILRQPPVTNESAPSSDSSDQASEGSSE